MRKLMIFISIVVAFSCNKASDSGAYAPSAGQGGSLARFTVVGNYLYTVDKENLKVFNITDPANPGLTRTIHAGFEIETIFPFRDKLFVGSSSMIHIFSIDDPSNPQKLSEAISPTVMRRCDPVVAKDDVAYATLRTNGPCGGTASTLAVYDIRDIHRPVPVKSIEIGEPYGLGYSGNTLYVCDRFYGLTVYDISKPFSPVFVKNVSATGNHFYDVIPFNNLLICWVTKGVLLYEISDPKNPVLINQIN